MTPAIEALKSASIRFEVLEYEHNTATAGWGEEATDALGLAAEQVFKTLIVQSETGELIVGIVPVSAKLSMKAIAKAARCKKAAMADGAAVERSTGYVLGGVSPLGQKRRLMTIIDASAAQFDCVYVSAGKRGAEIALAPADLRAMTDGVFAEIATIE